MHCVEVCGVIIIIPLRRRTGEAIDVTRDEAVIGDVTVRKFDDVIVGLWLLERKRH